MTFDHAGPSDIPSLYVARPLDLPPLIAQAAFDAQRHRLPRTDPFAGWAIETDSSELRISGSGVVTRYGPACALRRSDGQLRSVRKHRPIAVEVEVAPWSDSRCQIGIRPRGGQLPRTDGRARRRYFALAVDAAQALAHTLEAQVEAWASTQLRRPGAGEVAHVG
jgi:hypothetical protein